MRRIEAPMCSARNSFNAAVESIRVPENRRQYISALQAVVSCCDYFDSLATSENFDSLPLEALRVSEIHDDAMISLYEKQFINNSGTREIRDSIRNCAPNGICPYCGQGAVYQIDHYLPKRPFSGITVHPSNLVPACRDCNFEKRDFYPGSDKPSVLHPYFDSILEMRWLYASIVQSSSGMPVAEFRIQLPGGNALLESRLDSHMRVFNLYVRFRDLASQVFCDFEYLLSSPIGEGMRLQDAINYLRMSGTQQSGGWVNSWEFALYEAMASDKWYLENYLMLD